MKALISLALAGLSCMAAAADGRTQSAQEANATDVERYEYATNLDIARVIHTDDIPDDVCEVVPIHMVYEDSHGERHTLEYSVMGRGCGGF
ncbi:hypothetical protein AvCA_03950 [Azotobacter vinelandii CA]|uniref:DUF2790 domain-containing protein n=2 Tax=Azotobacter vinelandii TaxID=354 RepID=C1DJ68_AZOVD|nr:DUF2790 domain-containing protein [Azotobacter vinelandii]ACO76653.1 conserved hypothetical protein [Azotobacter vinelandii DJ]AGK17322.1 hypothetical protein AvCA_03950 [Azotobacter vinelandii CA]AGK19265.1 hypothetical protein AvCA6_03950 [Azotobacter vinelandii CA6]SFX13087.1 Protein of unknown function [Azotobacter vinelandii]GLK58828.1 topoisomerase II [Azotobacter vinelandii]